MNFKLTLISLVLLTCIRCKPSGPANELVGNWYGFDSDSSYHELYINDTMMILNHEKLGLAEYYYQKNGNRIITTTPLFFERTWKLEQVNDSSFTLSDTTSIYRYSRLEGEVDFFESAQDSLEFFKFRDGFVTRHQRFKLNTEE